MTGRAAIRLFFAVEALLWALVLVQPGDALALSRSLAGMAALMSEDKWAIVFGAESALLLLSFRAWPRFRVAVSALVCLGHGGLAYTLGRASNLVSLGAMSHLAAAGVLGAWLLAQDIVAVRRKPGRG